jgi:hypothetical protein
MGHDSVIRLLSLKGDCSGLQKRKLLRTVVVAGTVALSSVNGMTVDDYAPIGQNVAVQGKG